MHQHAFAAGRSRSNTQPLSGGKAKKSPDVSSKPKFTIDPETLRSDYEMAARQSRSAPGASLTEDYQKMQQALATLTAQGVELPTGYTLDDESPSTHFWLAMSHLGRCVSLGMQRCCGGGGRPATPLASQDGSGGGASGSADGVDDYTPTAAYDVDLVDGVPKAEAMAARGLIMPVGTWKEKWDLLILFLILYSAVVVPVRVCFDANAEGFMWFLEVSMTFAFIADIYFTFNTVFFDTLTGNWVTSHRTIAANYLRGWFWIDAPSSVPVEIINIFLEHSNTLGLLRFLRMFRLLRLLRLLKIEEYIETLENQFDINLRILRVVFMLVKICFLSHILGCFWYYTAAGAKAAGEETTWTNSYDDGRIAQEGVGLGTRYLYSVYWAVTTLTTVGYGDIIPTNDAERTYALCAMLISALVFGYMISNIGSLVASMDRQAALVEEKTDAVKEYVAFRGLPRDLSLRVKKHYAFYYTQRAAFDEMELLEGLSPSLRSEVTRFVLKETLGKLPLFTQQLDPEFQLEVFPLLKPVSYAKGETVFRRGEPSRDLIFLLKGEVGILSPIDDTITSVIHPTKEVVLSREADRSVAQEVVMELDHSGSFGESVLTGRRRSASHKALTWCETLVLAKDDLIELFKNNPRQGKRIVRKLLGEVERRERLQGLMRRFVISTLPATSPARAALIIQRRWGVFAAQIAALDQGSADLINFGINDAPAAAAGVALPGGGGASAAPAAPAEPATSATLRSPLSEAKALASGLDAASKASAETVLAEAEAKVQRLFERLRSEMALPTGGAAGGGGGSGT